MQKKHRQVADSPISSFIAHHSSLQRKQRFTLIELLVVIAIIAILAGILLPALGKTKSTAQRIRCVGNTKQIALTTISYLDNYNSGLPYADLTRFAALLEPYMGENNKAVANGVAVSPVWKCPAARWQEEASSDSHSYPVVRAWYVKDTHLGQLAAPARTSVFIEYRNDQKGSLDQCYNIKGPAPHNGYMNFPLLDGHAESIRGIDYYHTNCRAANGCSAKKLPVITRP